VGTCHSTPSDSHGLAAAGTRWKMAFQIRMPRKRDMDAPSPKAKSEAETLSGCRYAA